MHEDGIEGGWNYLFHGAKLIKTCISITLHFSFRTFVWVKIQTKTVLEYVELPQSAGKMLSADTVSVSFHFSNINIPKDSRARSVDENKDVHGLGLGDVP